MSEAHESLADEVVTDPTKYPIRSSNTVFEGHIVAVRQDEVTMSDDSVGQRDVVVHPGAVGVVAVDENDRVVMIRQFRHPVRSYLWEIPAGLKDVADEPPVQTARRELLEEAGVVAERWDLLVDMFVSPGGSTEEATIFLARDLRFAERPAEFELSAEELDLEVRLVPIEDLQTAVLAGRIRNSLAVAGVLAASVAKAAGWQGLRPPD